MRDTIEVAEPFKEARNRANAPPGRTERNNFYVELQRLLVPSFAVTKETVSIDEVPITEQDDILPWYFFAVYSSFSSGKMLPRELNRLVTDITKEANKTGCSRVIVHEEGRLLVGMLGQYRYWTLSRARLCALDILRNYLDKFPMRSS